MDFYQRILQSTDKLTVVWDETYMKLHDVSKLFQQY